MFKANWEKTSVIHQLPQGTVEQMVRLAYPDKKLIRDELIAGGCANLNFKILLENEIHPLILRVYLRDKDAVYREQNLGVLVKQIVPVPQTYYIGEINDYHFAITEFMPGISLRDLLLNDLPHDTSLIMHEVGFILSNIAKHEFSEAGLFDKDLNVTPYIFSDELAFAKECLEHETVLSVLTPEIISNITLTLGKYVHLFPNANEKHLVHADFDPVNILVNEVNGTWKISGVLDWEFAFSGSVLFDVANMLRYAHKMPSEFQDAFLKGLEFGGIKLPENWRITIQLLNLLSLLDCLKRSDPKNSPNQCTDIYELIQHILTELNTVKIKKHIDVVPYDPNWPMLFELESIAIKKALGDNCLAIHHIGSTSVPGLAAKPKIDMIAVVKDPMSLIDKLETIGIQYRGEYNIPLHYGFSKRGTVDLNIHAYQEGHPEIELNLLFRDYLRSNPVVRDEYAALKEKILLDQASFEQGNFGLRAYTLRKGDFIRKILKDAGFKRLRMLKCSDETEWARARYFRQKYFFDKAGIQDPYTWTFNHPEHEHLVLYEGTDIIGYAHIQLWPNKRAAIRIIVIDEEKRNHGYGGQFLSLCAKWLKSRDFESIHTESSPNAVNFYRKNGYVDMPFNDPDGYESSIDDTPLGKQL